MHGKQVIEASKRAIYRKLAKVEYCMSLGEVMEFSLIKLGTYIKLCECGYATNTLNSRAVIQKDIDILEECSHRNPRFCQHAKMAKICAVCDTGALLVWEQFFRKEPADFSAWRNDYLRETTQPSVPGGSQIGGAPVLSAECCENNWLELKQGSFKECVKKNIFTSSQTSCEACCPKNFCSLYLKTINPWPT